MTSQDSQYADATLPDAAPVGMAKIGGELRLVRERAGWKLDEVAAALRIRLPYLEAIEQGDLKALPGPAYEVGFIRTYANALGLDGDEILRRFRAEGAGKATTPELRFLAPVPDRAVPTGAIVLLGVVILLVGYGLWFLHSEGQRRLAAAVPAVPAQLAPLAVPPVPPVVKPPAPPAAVQTAAQPPPAAAVPPVATNATAPAGTAAPAQTATTTAAAPVPATPTTPAGTPAAPNTAVSGKVIQATGDSWVEVKDASSNILFSRLMHAGDSWPVPDMPGLTMTAGNAGGTDIAENGTAGAPLGGAGTVVHNYALTPPSPSATPPAPDATASPNPPPQAATSPAPVATPNSSPAKAAN
jgi:cytoskeleton protein RodZ